MHNLGDGNGHSHNHHHESTMSFEDQLKTLFEHWINHNASHAGTYKDWAAKAVAENMPETAKILEEVAVLTEKVSEKIREASDTL